VKIEKTRQARVELHSPNLSGIDQITIAPMPESGCLLPRHQVLADLSQ